LIVLPSNAPDNREGYAELTGSTLSVYWYLLSRRPDSVGVREVQRALGFSSSSTANYHLEKLMDLGLLDKNPSGDYRIKRVVKVGVLSAFVFVGRYAFPKHLLYSILTSVMILVFLLLFAEALSLTVFVALSPGILAAAIFWYETFIVWRRKPSRAVGSRDSNKRSKV